MSEYVDVHLVLDPFERQFNLWRNIARFYARTDYVMMLDVDFAICTDFRSGILKSEAVMNKLREGRMALVVPAFEFIRQKDGLNASTFPTDKKVFVFYATIALPVDDRVTGSAKFGERGENQHVS